MSVTRHRRPTLSDVAELTGYSASTVSRALKNDPRVKAATRDEIARVAEEVGFSQNALARSLRRGGASSLLGLIVPNILDPFYAAVVSGVQEAAHEQDRDVIVGCHQDEVSAQKKLVEQMLQHRVQAILIVPVSSGVPSILKAESKFGTVIVAIDRPISNLDSDIVTTQNELGASTLAEALLERGHRRIAVATLDLEIYTQKVRLAALRETFAAAGVPEALTRIVTTDHHGRVDGRELDEALTGDGTTAVISTAVMPLVRVLESMVRTGQALQLASFDFHPMFELLDTTILTVEQNPQEIGRAAVTLLNQRAENPRASAQRIELPIGPLRAVGAGQRRD